MQIVWIRPSNFTGGDGTQVSGQNIYLVYPLERGEGHGSDRVFVTNAKLSQWPYRPKVGDEVEVVYNRYGKVSEIVQRGGGK